MACTLKKRLFPAPCPALRASFFLYPEHLSPKVLLLDAVPSQEFMQFADLFHSGLQTVDEQTVKKKKTTIHTGPP